MGTVSANPAFQTYAICAGILALKMIYSAVYTGVQRQRNQGYVNEEDASVFGQEDSGSAAAEHPAVAHALRIQRNDLENIPVFLAIALIYVLGGATATAATAYFWTFTIARILHTVFYTAHMQPWRAASYGVGALCVIGMSVQLVF